LLFVVEIVTVVDVEPVPPWLMPWLEEFGSSPKKKTARTKVPELVECVLSPP